MLVMGGLYSTVYTYIRERGRGCTCVGSFTGGCLLHFLITSLDQFIVPVPVCVLVIN